MKRPSPLTVILCALCFLIMILGLLFSVLRLEMNRGSFLTFYTDYGIEQRTGISASDASDAVMALIDYMECRRDTIQLTVTEYGRPVEMYNQREIDHMKDVRALYQAFAKSVPLSLAAAATVTAAHLICRRRGRSGLAQRSYLAALCVFFGILLILGIWALADFTSFWTEFHHLFFTNDLWLLDPATSRMIRICPESLFSSLAAGIAVKPLGILLAAAVAAAFSLRKVTKTASHN